MEAPAPRQRIARVERKGRFTITDLSPHSPCIMHDDDLPFQDDDSPLVSVTTGDAVVQPLLDAVVVPLADPILVVAKQVSPPPTPQLEPQTIDVDDISPLASPLLRQSTRSATMQAQPETPEHVIDNNDPYVVAAPDIPYEKALSDATTASLQSTVESEPEPSPSIIAPSVVPPGGDNDPAADGACVVSNVVPPSASQQQQQQQQPPALAIVTSITAVDAGSTDALTGPTARADVVDVVADDAGVNDEEPRASSPNPSQLTLARRESRRSSGEQQQQHSTKRKSRFTITELTTESPSPHTDANDLFAQNDADGDNLDDDHELLQSASTDTIDDAAACASTSPVLTAGTSQDYTSRSTSSVDYHLFQTQARLSHRTAVAAGTGASTAASKPAAMVTLARTNGGRVRLTPQKTPQKMRVREHHHHRRQRQRSMSPIRSSLQMSDLATQDSGTDSYADEHEPAASRATYRSSAFFADTTASTAAPPASSRMQFPPESPSASPTCGYSRRYAASRSKSITISAAQFLQQQQTIAALVRQQQELKHVIGVLQTQQQQLMSVPVQLHELRLENAKDDGKDEMMRELYVQVDSLMRANDSLQVLLTQAEKEAQDRAQESEVLTEENDRLLARCEYLERKFIDERKVTFVLEEEITRFRMISLTHELEQRSSMSTDLE